MNRYRVWIEDEYRKAGPSDLLGFAGAVLALVVGVQLLTGGGSVDVAASSVGGVEATAPAAPTGDADSGVGAAPDSLVVSTTVGAE